MTIGIGDTVRKNLNELRERIYARARRSGRSGGDVELVVVSKFRTVEEILAVIDAGVTQIGENRVQEADKKKPELPPNITYRMIGHLQRNKAADALRIFDAVDSVDSLRIGGRLSEEAVKAGKRMPVLVQVNSSKEQTKHGFEPEEIEAAAAELSGMPGIEIRGMMTIGPLTDDENELRRAFETTRKLFESIRKGMPGFETLSMGMTDDFETAIEEGSNMVRIGRAVFEGR